MVIFQGDEDQQIRPIQDFCQPLIEVALCISLEQSFRGTYFFVGDNSFDAGVHEPLLVLRHVAVGFGLAQKL